RWLATVAGGAGRLGLRLTPLSRGAVHGLAPGLSPAFGHALMSREDWRLEPAAALTALRAAAQAAGVRFKREAVREAGAADWLVVATGAGQDLAALAPELATLAPIKGHILKVGLPAATAMVVRGEGGYAVPGQEGLAIGATMEPGVGDPTVDAAQAAPLAAAGARLFPAIAHAPQTLMAGVRAATPDGLPMVGRSSAPGVLLAVGARRNGWLLAPLAAGIIAACVTVGEGGPYAARLDPARFGRGG
ncbi:MAG: FAD-dependent oxidoreductase, partial [Phenylobacterium sp.]